MINDLIELGKSEMLINIKSLLNTFKDCSNQAKYALETFNDPNKNWLYFNYNAFKHGMNGDFIIFTHKDIFYRMYYICPDKCKNGRDRSAAEENDKVVIVKVKKNGSHNVLFINNKYCELNDEEVEGDDQND